MLNQHGDINVVCAVRSAAHFRVFVIAQNQIKQEEKKLNLKINPQYSVRALYVVLQKISQVELEVEQNVLSSKVKLTDGSTGHIFSRNPGRNDARLFTYNCHICSVPNLPGERCLYTHISGRRHQQRLATQPFNANLFRAPLHRSNKSTFLKLLLLLLFYCL